MSTRLLFALLTLSVLPICAGSVYAQASLNDIKIEACGSKTNLENLISNEEKRGLVMDARPFAINQSTGKLSFKGKTGRVSVVHTNPFIYRYTISVTQQELKSSAVTDFIEILLPPGLRLGAAAKQAADENKKSIARIVQNTSASSPVARRLDRFNPADCRNPNDAICTALKTMNDEYAIIKKALALGSFPTQLKPPESFRTFNSDLSTLRDDQADAVDTCTNAGKLHAHLNSAQPATILDTLDGVGAAMKEITLNANDLIELADKFADDDDLTAYVVRCGGFNCVPEFKNYAESVRDLMVLYGRDLADLTAVAQAMKQALDLTTQMRQKQGVFARSFDVIKKFEFTEATISVARTKLDEKAKTPANQADDDAAADDDAVDGRHHSAVTAAAPAGDDDDKKDGDKDDDKDKEKEKKDSKQKANALSADMNESIQIGRPRFLLSGGLVVAPLRRQTFESVKGFTHDANGNPTGDGDKNVVGFVENSPRRTLPMVMLNTRLSSFNPTSLFFSLGVTAKHDDNVDVEYLLGPSVSLLNDRALFTFGAYVGKVQNLVADVKVGDEIPDDAGDAKLFTKRYSWKPGFSFTYVFSENEKTGQSFTSGGGDTGGKGELKNEIRIGGIPFNLAMGLAYTSLEERTYDEVVGFARDREGKLTNGENLTRIAGLTSSSSYRLVPLAFLHTRLLNFGNRSFYFSTGVSGKKIDDKVAIEYLLGGTVNAYRRKIFLTFGAFAGKQSVLGGDFFEGAKLDKEQSVTTTTRYVWKPAFAISYDISRIFRSGSQ